MNVASQVPPWAGFGGFSQSQAVSSRTSCDRCKRMKIKCERRGESCVNCIARNATCYITLVKRKQKAKKKHSDIQDVESRIERLESALRASGIDPDNFTEENSSAPTTADDLAQDVTDRLATLLVSEGGASRYLGASSGFSLFSPQGLQWIFKKTGTNELTEFISILSKANESPWSAVNVNLWHSMSPYEREPLPTKEIADIFVNCFFDTFNSIYPLFDKITFENLYDLQYTQRPIGGPAWYACLNIVLSIGSMIWHVYIHGQKKHLSTETGSFTEDQGWKYFRNACSCLTDLMFKDCNLMAVQAILGMAVIQQTTLESQTFCVLIAAAGRLAHGIGLHRKLDHSGLSEAEIDQRRNVFWMVYYLDKSIGLRLGQPSVMIDDDIGVGLPIERPIRETMTNGTSRFNLFRSHAELAMLQSRIYTELYSVRARNRSHLERLRSIGRLDIALLEWKERLPIEIRPEEPIQCSQEQKVPVIMLQFAYFNCLTTIHRISNSGLWTDQRARNDSLSASDVHLNPRIYASHSICLSAARASIRLLQMIDLNQRTPHNHVIWMALYYPLSGFLILFSNLLQNPQDTYISSDIILMDLVRSFLSPNAVGSTLFNANITFKIFTELVNVARKFVDKVHSQSTNKSNRLHDRDEEGGWQRSSTLSKESEAEGDFQSAIEDFATDSRAQPQSSSLNFIPSIESTAAAITPITDFQPPHSSNTAFQLQSSSNPSACSKEIPSLTHKDFLSLSSAEAISIGLQESMDMMNGQELGWGQPMFSESFEWDLANLWNSETLNLKNFEDAQNGFKS